MNKYTQLHAKKEKLFDEGRINQWGLSNEDNKSTDEATLKENKELAMKLILSKVV